MSAPRYLIPAIFGATAAPHVKAGLAAMVSEGATVIVTDWSGVTYVDLAGFSAMLSVQRQFPDVVFVLDGIPADVAPLVRMVKLDQRLFVRFAVGSFPDEREGQPDPDDPDFPMLKLV